MKHFLKHNLFLFCILLLVSCKALRVEEDANYTINYLDEYILPASNDIGGLSGIDYNNGEYVLVSDLASKPRIYTAKINIKNKSIDSIIITKRITIDSLGLLKDNALDMESIRYVNNKFLIATEGLISANKPPLVFSIAKDGTLDTSMALPDLYKITSQNSFRNNAAFEGLTLNVNQDGFWVSTESPLINDGSEAKIFDTKTPVRFSEFDFNGKLLSQYVYNLERLGKIPLLPFAVNGVTEILQLTTQSFIVVERSFSAGYGQKGNRVRLFLASITNATNVKSLKRLENADYTPMKKQLLLDSKTIKKQLTFKFIDNIEGICLGPQLPNGNFSLVLVSDNNFNSIGPQLNQFILLELKHNL